MAHPTSFPHHIQPGPSSHWFKLKNQNWGIREHSSAAQFAVKGRVGETTENCGDIFFWSCLPKCRISLLHANICCEHCLGWEYSRWKSFCFVKSYAFREIVDLFWKVSRCWKMNWNFLLQCSQQYILSTVYTPPLISCKMYAEILYIAVTAGSFSTIKNCVIVPSPLKEILTEFSVLPFPVSSK